MRRRHLLLALATLPPAARAHHGWSSFDQTRPLWIAGRAAKVSWRNPHAELDLDVEPGAPLPPAVAAQPLPAQTAPVDGPALLKAAVPPTRRDRRWHVELAPIARLEAWKVPEVRVGDAVGVLGYTFTGEKGDAVLRAEYLYVGGQVYGLRSSPA
jgi:hypothetical protein